MARAKNKEVLNPFTQLAEGLRQQVREPNLHGYVPHAKQVKFHSSGKKGRLYIGGNRSGKTVGGVCEDLWWIRGDHPYRDIPEGPIRGRVVGVDFLNGIEKIILPQFKRWTPPSLLVNGSWDDSWDKQLRTLNFRNGSFIEFMSYDQDTDKFAGTSRHFVHYDEEPPRHIFNECQARLVDTNGDWWISMTPVEGMTWVFDDLYSKSNDGQNKLVDVIQVDMTENPHLNAEAIENFLGTLSDEERKAREHGSFVQLGGLVYPQFNAGGVHTAPPFSPKHAPEGTDYYVSMDHGWRNPSAWLWHAVLPSNEVVTFDEHYAGEMTIEEHSVVVKKKNKRYGIEPIYVGDPAIHQTSAITGTSVHTEYAMLDIPIASGVNAIEIGVPKVQSYLRVDPAIKRARWTITELCPNLRREMSRLRWATYASKKMQYANSPQEKIHKKDDHACDSARYFFTFMPDLTPEKMPEAHNPLISSGVIGETYDRMLSMMTLPDETRWEIQKQENDLFGGEEYEYEKG